MMKGRVLLVSIVVIFLLGIGLILYFDLFHSSVETIEKLIGKDYTFARNNYFSREPDAHYICNVNHITNEFDGGIFDSKEILTDSIVEVYTWNYFNHKKTIWVGKTMKSDEQVIDALRYKNSVRF
jgi:hypothetical protein